MSSSSPDKSEFVIDAVVVDVASADLEGSGMCECADEPFAELALVVVRVQCLILDCIESQGDLQRS
jgi:hypothetical protein